MPARMLACSEVVSSETYVLAAILVSCSAMAMRWLREAWEPSPDDASADKTSLIACVEGVVYIYFWFVKVVFWVVR